MALLNSLIYDKLQTFIYGDYSVAAGFFIEHFKKAGMQKGDTVVDVGCGTGLLSMNFTRAGFNYTGLDMEADRIQAAKKRNPQAQFLCGNLLDKEILSQLKLKYCLMHGVLHHLSNDEVQNLFVTLKNNGCKVLCTMDPLRPENGSNQLATLMCNLDDGKFIRTEENYKKLYASASAAETYVHKFKRWPAKILYSAAYFSA